MRSLATTRFWFVKIVRSLTPQPFELFQSVRSLATTRFWFVKDVRSLTRQPFELFQSVRSQPPHPANTFASPRHAPPALLELGPCYGAVVMWRLALCGAALWVTTARAEDVAAPPVGYYVTRSTTAMGTVLQARAYLTSQPTATREAEVARHLEAAIAEVRRLEVLMTTWQPTSDISKINAQAGGSPVRVSSEVFEVLTRSQEFAQRSSGAFDVSFYALRGLWHFDEDLTPTLPDPAELRRRLPLINYRNIQLSAKDKTVRLAKVGMAVNLGGIGKGYAVDAAVKLLRARGVVDGMVQAGGDLMLFGSKSGQPFKAGVRDPRSVDPSDYFAVCEVKDHAFSTAGDYERSFVRQGMRYHHILDPRTGQPARGARSVTVYAKDATTADGLDDAVLILGPERGLPLIESYPDAGAIVVDAQNRVHISRRLQGLCTVLHPPTPGI